MLKNNKLLIVFLALLFCSVYYLGYAEVMPNLPVALQTKTIDVNKDGKPDVTVYGGEKGVAKVEADTNYDGKPDVTITLENGKFKSAEVDTDYNGTPDKKINTTAEFNEWVNKDKPDFKDSLGFAEDGTYTLSTF